MRLSVMISSQIRPSLNFKNGEFTYSELRDCIKEKLETCQLYNCKLFDVCWISEHPQGSADTISDMCKDEIDQKDIILVLYRGSGEMCYLEFQHAMERWPKKVCIIKFPLVTQSTPEDLKFQQYFDDFHRSWDCCFTDATIISAPFGVYLADNIEHLQLVFLSQCRTEAAIGFQVKRFRDWLSESKQLSTIIERAHRRRIICEAIAKTQK